MIIRMAIFDLIRSAGEFQQLGDRAKWQYYGSDALLDWLRVRA